MHMKNQKKNLQEPKSTMQAVTIGSGKAMSAEAKGVKPMQL